MSTDSYLTYRLSNFKIIYTHFNIHLYMHNFRRIFLSNYWWQESDIWSQASYRYAILWEALLDPSDSCFLFADLVGSPSEQFVHFLSDLIIFLYLPVSIFNGWALTLILHIDCRILKVWLFTNEHEQVWKKLGSFIEECFLLRGHNWSYRYH
jgi:hypothetical protein